MSLGTKPRWQTDLQVLALSSITDLRTPLLFSQRVLCPGLPTAFSALVLHYPHPLHVALGESRL